MTTHPLDSRTEYLTKQLEGLPNKQRTRLIADEVKQISESHNDTIYKEYIVPSVKQTGFVLQIPPAGGHRSDSEYILISAHGDGFPSIFSALGIHYPAANDNAYALALASAYAELRAGERGERGIIIAGIPGEEGFGLARLVLPITVQYLVAMASETILGTYFRDHYGINPSLFYLLGLFAPMQLFDLVGGPFKIGLAGSTEKTLGRVLQKDLNLDLEQIIAVNLDMIGATGSTTSIINPYTSHTGNVGTLFFPKKMDRNLATEVEMMLLTSLAKLKGQVGINNINFFHNLILGTSDHANMAKYIKRTSSLLHIDDWDNLHTIKDTSEQLKFKHAQLYQKLFDSLLLNLDKPWKNEIELGNIVNAGLVPAKTPNATMSLYANNGSHFCLMRYAGGKNTNPLNILYQIEPLQDSQFRVTDLVTYGVQDFPDELLKYADVNLEDAVGNGKLNRMRTLDNRITLLLADGEPRTFVKKENLFNKYAKPAAAYSATFVGERALGTMIIGFSAALLAMYNQPGVTSITDEFIRQAAQLRESIPMEGDTVAKVVGTGEGIWKQLPGFTGLGLITAFGLKTLQKIVPFLLKQVRGRRVSAGNTNLDYFFENKFDQY